MVRVCVVGAGPTGLTAAVELARLGADVTVIEKRTTVSGLSRAVGISHGSMDLLAPSGVAEALIAEAVRFQSLRFFDETRLIARFPLNCDARSQVWGLAQTRTEHHLTEALSRFGGTLLYGTEVKRVAQTDTEVTVQTAGDRFTADYVIAADGMRSDVRASLGVQFWGYDLDKPWSIADVDATGWDDPDSFHGYLIGSGDVVVVVPLSGTRFRVIASRPIALDALPVPMSVTRVHRTGSFKIAVRQVKSYTHGRILLAGDAAHCHSPVGGRGMNLGIADAADAAARIMADDVSGYSSARRAVGHATLHQTERARKLLQSTVPLVRPALKLAMRGIAANDTLRRAATRRALGF